MWTEDKRQIDTMIQSFFQRLFTEERMGNLLRKARSYIGHFPLADLKKLDKCPNGDKIRNIVMKMKGNKAPGEDGLDASFYQNTWDITG